MLYIHTMMKKRSYKNYGKYVNEYVYSDEYAKYFDLFRLGYIDGLGFAADYTDESLDYPYNNFSNYQFGFDLACATNPLTEDYIVYENLKILYKNLCEDLDNEYEKLRSRL
jgi:hypothetical protein